MGQPSDTPSTSPGRELKLVRLIEEYDLHGIGAELEQRWTADEDRSGLRELAEYFNQELLAVEMTEADMEPLDGEIENVHRLLTEDGVSVSERTRTRRRLERKGVDVETLREEFVTYQAVRTYLTKHREAEYSRPDRDRTASEVQNIQRLRGRTATVTETKLATLRKSDEIILGEFHTLVDIVVICEDCGTQYPVTDLLERGGCDCPELST